MHCARLSGGNLITAETVLVLLVIDAGRKDAGCVMWRPLTSRALLIQALTRDEQSDTQRIGKLFSVSFRRRLTKGIYYKLTTRKV